MPQRRTGNGDRIKKDGKQKNKAVKPITLNYGDPDPKLQYNIPKGVDDDKKIRPKDVFEGFNEGVKRKSKPKDQKRVSSKGKRANLNRRKRGSKSK